MRDSEMYTTGIYNMHIIVSPMQLYAFNNQVTVVVA